MCIEGHSSLYEASSHGRTKAVRLLLQNRANVNLITKVLILNDIVTVCPVNSYND